MSDFSAALLLNGCRLSEQCYQDSVTLMLRSESHQGSVGPKSIEGTSENSSLKLRFKVVTKKGKL